MKNVIRWGIFQPDFKNNIICGYSKINVSNVCQFVILFYFSLFQVTKTQRKNWDRDRETKWNVERNVERARNEQTKTTRRDREKERWETKWRREAKKKWDREKEKLRKTRGGEKKALPKNELILRRTFTN